MQDGIFKEDKLHDGVLVVEDRLDDADVLYEKTPYPLPVSLSIGDKVLIEGAGAYTTTYAAVAFNGFPPLQQIVI